MRIQSMNGVTLARYPFDYDLTWMAFFTDAQGGIYARYGGREDDSAESHLSQKSLAAVMREVLRRHARGQPGADPSRWPTAYKTPEDIPTLAPMMARRREQCIHCHDVKGASLRQRQTLGQFAKEQVFTYPSPRRLGIVLDRDDQTRVVQVLTGSAAARAGLAPDDRLQQVADMPVLTFTDVQAALHLAPDTGQVPIVIQRGKKTHRLALPLEKNWRWSSDPSWRASLHVAGPGSGFWGQALSPAEKQRLGLPADKMALRITVLFGEHARRADLRVGDIVLAVDDFDQPLTIRQLQAHLHLYKNFGDRVTWSVLRGGQRRQLDMILPSAPSD